MHGNHMRTRGAGVAAVRGGRRDTGGLLFPWACQGKQCTDVPQKEVLVSGFAYDSVWFTNGGPNAQKRGR